MLPSQIEDGIIVDLALTQDHSNVNETWSHNSSSLITSEIRKQTLGFKFEGASQYCYWGEFLNTFIVLLVSMFPWLYKEFKIGMAFLHFTGRKGEIQKYAICSVY